MTKELHHFIDGKAAKGSGGRFGDVFNPATGEVSSKVPLASTDEVGAAIAAAEAALPSWAATPPARRAQVMFKFRQLLYDNLDDIALLVSAEHGKTIPDAKGSISRASKSSNLPVASRSF